MQQLHVLRDSKSGTQLPAVTVCSSCTHTAHKLFLSKSVLSWRANFWGGLDIWAAGVVQSVLHGAERALHSSACPRGRELCRAALYDLGWVWVNVCVLNCSPVLNEGRKSQGELKHVRICISRLNNPVCLCAVLACCTAHQDYQKSVILLVLNVYNENKKRSLKAFPSDN